jgi:hypothetical protein
MATEREERRARAIILFLFLCFLLRLNTTQQRETTHRHINGGDQVMFLKEILVSALSKGSLPDLFLDLIRHDILLDPVTVEGSVFSRDSIQHWFGVCESQKLTCTSPLTGSAIHSKLFTDNKFIKELLETYSQFLNRFRRMAMIGSDWDENDREYQLHFRFETNDIVSIQRLARLFIPIQKIPLAIKDFIPKWEAPQFVVIGEIQCGKSTLLERISLTAIFPIGDNQHTCLPIHLKLRQSAYHSPPVLRVIDTKKKVRSSPVTVSSSSFCYPLSDVGSIGSSYCYSFPRECCLSNLSVEHRSL